MDPEEVGNVGTPLQSSMEKRENAALLSKQETTSSLEDRAREEARETEKR